MSAPLHPSADEARRLLRQELAKGEYQSSKPGPLDRLAQAFWEWVQSLRFGSTSGTPTLALVVLLVVVIAGLVVVFLVYGLPRLNRRGRAETELFGSGDTRDATALRASAADAARSGDYATAIAETFRAIARSLGERSLLSTPPGTTAQEFGRRTATLFPSRADELRGASADFDDVRYLDREGTADAYERVSRLDEQLERSDPDGAGPSDRVTSSSGAVPR